MEKLMSGITKEKYWVYNLGFADIRVYENVNNNHVVDFIIGDKVVCSMLLGNIQELVACCNVLEVETGINRFKVLGDINNAIERYKKTLKPKLMKEDEFLVEKGNESGDVYRLIERFEFGEVKVCNLTSDEVEYWEAGDLTECKEVSMRQLDSLKLHKNGYTLRTCGASFILVKDGRERMYTPDEELIKMLGFEFTLRGGM